LRLLLDTHIILWAGQDPERLSAKTRALITDEDVTPLFSAVNIWEVAIKRALKRHDFEADPEVLRESLLDLGYKELPVTSLHVLKLMSLPAIHKDPFDRLLIAQATCECITLVTADKVIARYPGPILKV
jgi:PIN domain nuclease of toxin-antitoxin system